MRKYLVILFFCLSNIFCFSQHPNFRSRSDLGVFVGGMYYIGDLNQLKHFQNTNLAYGGIFRYNINSRIALRANVNYGNIEANDAEATNALLINRNLSFTTDIYEFASGIEFNYLRYQTGHPEFRFTPYFFVELGLFRINPKTKYNDDFIELRTLGTEGQGTELNSKDFYNRTQFCLPLGVGMKMSLAKNISFNIEFGVRKTFTDYIDDVGSNRFADRNAIAEANGPLVAELSNRSLDGSANGMRGNSATKDWYFVFGGILTYRLGPADKCSFK
ncbi:MAG: DUF6089 family protein [Flavobacteriia bacterium]|jgi:hypothetical protein